MEGIDVLEKIWLRQREQQGRIFPFDGRDTTTRQRMISDYLLGLCQEVSEMQRLIYAGEHALSMPTPTQSNMAIAGVDIFKYLISVMDLFGVTPSEFVQAFYDKTIVVDHKISQQRISFQAAPVVITDLDDCVVDWTDGFDIWCQAQGYPSPSEQGKSEAEGARELFYQSGGFLELEDIPGAIETLKWIREQGMKLVIITARPRWQHDRIYSDTLLWLEKHGIVCDAIFWGKDKADIVYQHIHPAPVVAFIEDRPRNVLDLATNGVPVIMFHGYSEWSKTHEIDDPNVVHATDWTQIREVIIKRSDQNGQINTDSDAESHAD